MIGRCKFIQSLVERKFLWKTVCWNVKKCRFYLFRFLDYQMDILIIMKYQKIERRIMVHYLITIYIYIYIYIFFYIYIYIFIHIYFLENISIGLNKRYRKGTLFLLPAPTHYSFTFNSKLLYNLKHLSVHVVFPFSISSQFY